MISLYSFWGVILNVKNDIFRASHPQVFVKMVVQEYKPIVYEILEKNFIIDIYFGVVWYFSDIYFF